LVSPFGELVPILIGRRKSTAFDAPNVSAGKGGGQLTCLKSVNYKKRYMKDVRC
jgi:hypothetical protein